jgi:membrane protein YqaA with SNARE-associated domain
MTQYLVVAAVVFAVNLLPAFGPPTWAVLVFFRLHSDVNAVGLVLVGAAAAMAGRFVLALAARKFGSRLRPERRQRLAEARAALTRHRAGALAGLTLFVVSPLPSAQLFIAAGLLDVPLVPVTAAFFAGRLVSYSIYVSLATVAQKHLGAVLSQFLGSPLSIALQVVFLALVAALPFVDWGRLFTGRRSPSVTDGADREDDAAQ